ncbi:MAG: hypothetical protein QNJ78_11330 [Gammaproteobacteria bacterium]|nr:hypothetical protein [Gammaproteobacteria bacterium]
MKRISAGQGLDTRISREMGRPYTGARASDTAQAYRDRLLVLNPSAADRRPAFHRKHHGPDGQIHLPHENHG